MFCAPRSHTDKKDKCIHLNTIPWDLWLRWKCCFWDVSVGLSLWSLCQVEFTFDKNVMTGQLTECRDLLLKLVEKHLTPKSLDRIRHVFNHYSDPELLTHLYDPKGTLCANLTKICSGLNRMIEEKKLWTEAGQIISIKTWTEMKLAANVCFVFLFKITLDLCGTFFFCVKRLEDFEQRHTNVWRLRVQIWINLSCNQETVYQIKPLYETQRLDLYVQFFLANKQTNK